MQSLDFAALRGEISRLLSARRSLVVSTCDGQRVTARTVFCASDGLSVYFLTSKAYIKYRQILRNPNVALCFDNVQLEAVAVSLGHPMAEENLRALRACGQADESFLRPGKYKSTALIRASVVRAELWKDGARVFLDAENQSAWQIGRARSAQTHEKPEREISLSPIDSAVRPAILRNLDEEWGGRTIVSLGVARDAADCGGFYAGDPGDPDGYILTDLRDGECEILVLHCFREHRGVGRALMSRAVRQARDEGCRRIFLITTNDNSRAIRFYQQFGMELADVRLGAIDEARKIKPSIPYAGCDGIPLRHEFLFSIHLDA